MTLQAVDNAYERATACFLIALGGRTSDVLGQHDENNEIGDGSDLHEAGIYSWFIEKDQMYGDSLIADLYGLDPKDTVAGLPLDTYFARLHDEDRAQVKQQVQKAVLDGQPYHAEHRVMNAHGQYRWVVSMGRCFRDQNRMPLLFSGIMYPIDQLTEAGDGLDRFVLLDSSG